MARRSGMPMARCAAVSPWMGRLPAVALAAATVIGCDGSVRRAPTQPTLAGPLPIVQLTVTPNPLQPVILEATPDGARLLVRATLTFTETAGGSGRLVNLSTSVVVTARDRRLAAGTVVSLANVVIAPQQSTSTQQQQEFAAVFGTQSMVWRASATGVDTLGRPFEVAPIELPIEVPPSLRD